MRNGYLKSSPHFFRLIGRAALACALLVCLVAPFVEAPLQEQANLARVPNPVKSAWFLLWIQEVVSHGSALINLVLLLGLFFLLLPWLPGSRPAERAAWLPRDQRVVSAITLAVFFTILALSALAFFFRGENWAFTAAYLR